MFNRIFSFIVICFIVTLFYSCQKEDLQINIEENLIVDNRSNTDGVPLVDNAKLAFETYNELSSVNDYILAQIGSIDWDENIYYTTDVEKSKGILYFPLLNPEYDNTNGLLIFSKIENMDKFNIDIVRRADVTKALNSNDNSSRINLLNETFILNYFDKTIFNRNEGNLLRFPNDEPEEGQISTFENDCGCLISPVSMSNDDGEEGEEGEENEGESEGDLDDDYSEPDAIDGSGEGNGSGGSGGGSGSGGGGDSGEGSGTGSWGGSGSWGSSGSGSSGSGSSGSGSGNPIYDYFIWLLSIMPQEAKGGEVEQAALTYVTISCSDSDSFGASDEIASINVEAALTMAQDLRLECDQYDCLFSNAELLAEVQSVVDDFYFTCSDESKTEIINNIMNDVCSEDINKPWVRLEELKEQLSNETHIDLSTLKEVCPKYYCLMEKMNDPSTQNNWLCEGVQDLTNNKKFKYTFVIGDNVPSINTVAKVDDYDPSFNKIITYIPSSYCDGSSEYSDLELASRIIHETIHAKFLSWVYDEFKNTADIPALGFSANFPLFNAVARRKFEDSIITSNHHYLMFNYYLDIVMVALWEMNNLEGELSDYEYYAHVLINTQDMADASRDPVKVAQFPWLTSLGLENFNLDGNDEVFGNFLENFGYNVDCLD